MIETDVPEIGRHDDEPHEGSIATRLNWLRAAVLGANDGIVSVAGLVAGVAGATDDHGAIVTAGLAGLVAGALSMAAGEYVSVSAQRDTEQALLTKERRELAEMPEEELAELAELYRERGLSTELAHQVAVQLTEHDALGAHAEAELGIDPEERSNPWHAAWASMAAFVAGALLPLLVITFSPDEVRVLVTGASVAAALALTGWLSALAGESPIGRAVLRNVTGGLLAMLVTYGVGTLFGAQLS